MGKFDRGKVVVCACFLAAYMLAYVAVGSFDSAYDLFSISDEIARHDAERALSAVFEISVLLGLFSLWVCDVRSWWGGAAIGVLTALAAGGFHVMAHMAGWSPLSMAAGFGGGLSFLILGRKRPVACALLGVVVALATTQALFIVQNI